MKLLFCNCVRVVVVDAEERRDVVWRKAALNPQEEKDFKEGFKNARCDGKEDDDDDDDLNESALSLPLFKHDDDDYDHDDDDDDDDDESTLEKTFARRNISLLLCVFLWEQKK